MINPPNTKSTSMMNVPQGWVLISKEFLSEVGAGEITPDEAIAYFDGLSPTWKEALSSQIPRREIVGELQSTIDEAQRVKRRQVTVLMGAGGEGKSTILRQAVTDFWKANSFQNILWHADVNTPLERSFINDLVFTRESWLIVSDEAERISKDVFNAVCLLHEKSKNNIQFLLCCRDTDWKGEHADKLSWNEHVLLVIKSVRGLTLEDANLIIEAWNYYGDRGLGKLSGLDLFEAASRLVEQAKSEAQNNAYEGSFLGAMLRVRIGEALQDHVKSLLARLDTREVPGTSLSLMDAFSYIVALHAENILLLTKTVLARAIGCPQEQLQRRVLGPLGEEAAISEHAAYVLTRHRAIAETAKDILMNIFGVDFDGIYPRLLRSAMEIKHARDLEINPMYWDQLPRTFFDRGNEKLGIQLARVLVDSEPTDPFPVVNLANLYRKARQPELAIIAFRDSCARVNADRGYYHEWSTSEGNNNNHFLSAWLDGIALADGVREKKHFELRVPSSLSGLANSFGKLFDQTGDRRFIEACAAAAQLGLQSRPDERAKSNLLKNITKSSKAKVSETDKKIALDRVITGIRLAWELRPREEDLPETVKPANELSFERLANSFNLEKTGR